MEVVNTANPSLIKELKTTSLANSGSYGNMFDIKAHKDLNITSLAIHCSKTGFVEVWTRDDGTFAEHYTSSEGWRMIANATIEGGKNETVAIPSSEFEPVTIGYNDTRSFFVRMLEPNLRYTVVSMKNSEPYVTSSDLDVLVGSGMYDYSFGEFELKGRVWNGVVYYTVDQNWTPPPQDLAISMAPSFAPVVTIPFEVNYTFSVMYESYRQSDVLKAADSYIFTKLETGLKDSTMEFHTQINKGQVQLVNVSSSFIDDTDIKHTECIPEQGEICSFVQSTVTTSYNGYIPTSMLKYTMLTLAPEAINALPFKQHVYIGIVPLFTGTVISLGGMEDSQQLDRDTTAFYEGTVKNFLNEMFEQDNINVTVTDVSTSMNDFFVTAERRRLQEKDNKSMDIETGVFGEYQPPPHVVFDKLVKESVEKNSELLVEKLKESPSFEKVKDIKIEIVVRDPTSVNSTSGKSSSIDVDPSNAEKNPKNLKLILGIAGVAFAILFFLVKGIKRGRQSHKSKKEDRRRENDNDINYQIRRSSIMPGDEKRRKSRKSTKKDRQYESDSDIGYQRKGRRLSTFRHDMSRQMLQPMD